MAHVACPLIDVNRRGRRADELISPEIRRRDQSEQFLNRRIGDRVSLSLGRHGGLGKRDPLSLAQSFVAEEEKCFLLDDRPAERGAELIALEGRLIKVAVFVFISQVEKVARVETFI